MFSMEQRDLQVCLKTGIFLGLIVLFSLSITSGKEVRRVFDEVNETNEYIKDIIRDTLGRFLDIEESELVIALPGRTAYIAPGKTAGVVFGFSPKQNGIYSYKTEFNHIDKKCLNISEENAEETLGSEKNGTFGSVAPGEMKYSLIKISVPETFPEGCVMRYIVTVSGMIGKANYEQKKHFDVVVSSEKKRDYTKSGL